MVTSHIPARAVWVRRIVLRCGVPALLGFAAYWVARTAWADHLSRSDDLARRERAVRLLPTATLYERLADKREELGDDPLPDHQRAAAVDPENSAHWMHIGVRAELDGNLVFAERCLLRAATLSRLYQPRYLLAQYYYRRQDRDQFRRWTDAAFQSAYGDITPLLDLSWRMRPDGAGLARQALSAKREIARQYLDFLVSREQSGPAHRLALHLAEAAGSEDLPPLLGYCNHSLSQGAAHGALEIWNLLCRRGLLPYTMLNPAGGVLLTNGDFARPPLSTGFDWHIERASWIQSVHFGRGVRLTLSGSQPDHSLIAWQCVPAVPGTRYGLKFDAHTVDDSGPPGMSWEVYDPGGTAVMAERRAGGALVFTASAGMLRLALVYQRPLGSSRLHGTVVITGVRLEPEP